MKQRANFPVRELVAIDQLLVGRPLSLELFQSGCIDDGAPRLKLVNQDIDHALPRYPRRNPIYIDFYSNTPDAPRT